MFAKFSNMLQILIDQTRGRLVGNSVEVHEHGANSADLKMLTNTYGRLNQSKGERLVLRDM